MTQFFDKDFVKKRFIQIMINDGGFMNVWYRCVVGPARVSTRKADVTETLG
jgi:hypothetical protein